MIHGSLGLVCGSMEDFGDTEKLQSAVRREQGEVLVGVRKTRMYQRGGQEDSALEISKGN